MLKGISNAKAEVAKLYIEEGIINPADQDKLIQQDAATAPEPWKVEFGAETPEELALLVRMHKKNPASIEALKVGANEPMNPPVGGGQLQGSSTGNKSSRKQSNSKYTVPESIPESVRTGIMTQLANTVELRKQNSENYHISMILIAKPDSVEIYGENAKGTVKKESFENFKKKVELFQSSGGTKGYKLEPDDAPGTEGAISSTSNFGILEKALKDGSTVDVYMSKTSTTPKGYVRTNVTTNESDTMTKDEMYSFVAMETMGILTVAEQGDPTVILRQIKSRRDAGDGESGSTRVVLADVDSKKAYENNKYDVLQELDTSAEKQNVTAKSALAMRIVDYDSPQNSKGQYKKRIIRISVTTQAYPLKLKPIYEEKFTGLVGRGQKDFTKLPQGEDLVKLNSLQLKSIAAMQQRISDADGAIELKDVADKLAAFSGIAAQAPDAVV